MSQSSVWYDCGFNVTCIDTGLFRDGLAACYLIEHDGEAALVDTGTRQFVTTDCGCLMNIAGYAEKNQKPVEGQHILSFLWSRTQGKGGSSHE